MIVLGVVVVVDVVEILPIFLSIVSFPGWSLARLCNEREDPFLGGVGVRIGDRIAAKDAAADSGCTMGDVKTFVVEVF